MFDLLCCIDVVGRYGKYGHIDERLQRDVLSVACDCYGCLTDLCHGGCARMAGQEIVIKIIFCFEGRWYGELPDSPLCVRSPFPFLHFFRRCVNCCKIRIPYGL